MQASPRHRFLPPVWVWHLALLIAISAAYESHFIRIGLNVRDEGWPLYVAMQMHAGGTLYDDILWVFPPGHALPAWFGAWLDPPGIEHTRIVYAAFNVALVVAMYALGRRLMPPSFALLGALLLSVAAPRTHLMHAVFGYRYLVFCVLGLLAFDRRLRSGDPRWMLAAGLATGVAFFFRYDAASSLLVALSVAVVAAQREPRAWLRDALWYAAGGLLVGLPVLAWFGWTVGVGRFLYEAAIHPLQMLQALPVPDVQWPRSLARIQLVGFFITLEFRLFALLYAAYAFWIGRRLLRAVRERRGFDDPLLLATVVWGAIYFVRAFGRADEPHLDSAIPPVCLLLAHAAHLGYARVSRLAARGVRLAAETAIVIVGFGLWVFLLGVDTLFFNPALGMKPRPEVEVTWSQQKRIDKIREWSAPGERILDLTASPMLHVASERLGPGYRDVVMPGTFAGAEEEERFLRMLEASPPALVLWPLRIFDAMPERSLRKTAPRVAKWVVKRYQMHAFDDEMAVLLPIRPGEAPPTVEDLTGQGRSLGTAPPKAAREPARRGR